MKKLTTLMLVLFVLSFAGTVCAHEGPPPMDQPPHHHHHHQPHPDGPRPDGPR